MAKAKKITRKELLKKDDAFLAAAGQSARWVAENRMQVVAGSVLAMATIFGIWGAVEYLSARDQEASQLFKRGLEILDGQVLPVGSEEQPDPDASEPTFASEEEKWKAARDQLDEVVRETGGSGVATLAAFLAADLHEKLGDVEAAEKGFATLVDEMSARDNLFFMAVERAAYLQEAGGDPDGAIKTLSKLVNVDTGFYSDFASFHQARLYLDKGENVRARNILERIENEFPSSPVLDDVRERLEQLGPASIGETQAGAADSTDASATSSVVEPAGETAAVEPSP